MGLDALSTNGKFLNRWSPASTCKCCCSRKLTLSGGLWWLAVVQILISTGDLISKIAASSNENKPPESLSEPTVEIGLALLMLDAIKNVKKTPILHFSFVQFILAVKGAIDCIALTLFLFITAGQGDDDGSMKVAIGVSALIYAWCTVPYKVYYSFIAWSFIATSFPVDLEELKKQDNFRLASSIRAHSVSRAEAFLFNSVSEDLLSNDGGTSKDADQGAYVQAAEDAIVANNAP
jgi:hypothetical protein